MMSLLQQSIVKVLGGSIIIMPPEVHPAFGISCYVSGCDAAGHGFKPGGNMLIFQASVSGSGQRFFFLANASMALALSAHTPWVQIVSHDSACWLAGLGFRHT